MFLEYFLQVTAPWVCALLGAALGAFTVWFSKRGGVGEGEWVGVLPLILVEMEQGTASFFGALHVVALVVVSAGKK
jgi:hypothetical protein